MIRSKPSDGYRQMPRYTYMPNTVYPNSYIRMHKTEEDEFMYLFIALRALMRGFDYYRPIVVVDGAHLGGAYKGTFLLASTLDGQVALPLAYGVVDTENDYSWTLFFEQFKNTFSGREEMSKNTLSDLYYSMTKAYIKEDFDILMAKVDKVDHRIKEYLEDAGEIASYTNDTLGRRFEEVLIINDFKSSNMKAVPSSEFIFSFYEAGRRYIVCLERKVCSYGRFQLDEIPCAHAIAVLKDKNVTDMYSYCCDYYKSDAIAKTYEIPIVPNCCGRCGQEGHSRKTCTFFPKEK
ncbi:hypothetical protein KY284_000789 [Solanum tuberosum]|nr:hypothetical protein KY284_000789 [Solanum tuberosum]